MAETLSVSAIYKGGLAYLSGISYFDGILLHVTMPYDVDAYFRRQRNFLLTMTLPVPDKSDRGFTRQGQRVLDYFDKVVHHDVPLSKLWAGRLIRRVTRYSLKLAKRRGRKFATSRDVCRAFRLAAFRTLQLAIDPNAHTNAW